MTKFQEKVYKVVAKIPKGQTMTYKEVAMAIGSPKGYRAVGNALSKNRDFKNIPCHRVIKSNGEFGYYVRGAKKKIELLREESRSMIHNS